MPTSSFPSHPSSGAKNIPEGLAYWEKPPPSLPFTQQMPEKKKKLTRLRAVQEFARQTLGAAFGIIFSVVVSLSALGSLNANIFATSKLCVQASLRTYFPRALANQHCASARDEADYLDETLPFCRGGVVLLAKLTQDLRWNQAVPM